MIFWKYIFPQNTDFEEKVTKSLYEFGQAMKHTGTALMALIEHGRQLDERITKLENDSHISSRDEPTTPNDKLH